MRSKVTFVLGFFPIVAHGDLHFNRTAQRFEVYCRTCHAVAQIAKNNVHSLPATALHAYGWRQQGSFWFCPACVERYWRLPQ